MTRFSLFSAVSLLAVVLAGALLGTRQYTVVSLRAERTRLTAQASRLTAEQQAAIQELVRLERTTTATKSLHSSQFDAIHRAIAFIKTLPAPPVPADSRPSPTGPRDNHVFAELLNDPEYARLCTLVFRQEVDVRHGAVLARFGAEPKKIAALTQLLVERKFVDLEAEHIAAQQGLAPIDVPAVRYHARDLLEDEIRSLVGDEVYAQLK